MARESDLVRETLDGYVSSVILGHIHICIHFIYIYIPRESFTCNFVGWKKNISIFKKTYLNLKSP